MACKDVDTFCLHFAFTVSMCVVGKNVHTPIWSSMLTMQILAIAGAYMVSCLKLSLSPFQKVGESQVQPYMYLVC